MTLLVLASLTATILVIVTLATPLSATATLAKGPRAVPEAMERNIRARLPRHLKPTHYRVRLMPFIWPGNFTTDGELDVSVTCLESAYNVTLNAKDIVIDDESVQVFEEDGEQNLGRHLKLSGPNSPASNFTDQDYVIHVSEQLKSGNKYRVQLRFVGNLNDILQGFYRSSYVDPLTGEKRWLAVTQFSPVDARRAYPCFDEPAMKSTFQFSIARTLNVTSRSNMPLESTEPVKGMPGWVWDHYPTTVPMSTYLTAFLVSDFETLGETEDRPLKDSTFQFRVWSRRDALNQTMYVSDIGPRILRHYEDYFGISFPLPKLDMVAVPDFGFSAMENWGLITFRESAMLFDPEKSTVSNKQNIAMVVGHELAHQWFGNLVTPAWWDDLWLKEGFASYVEYIGVNYVEPSWKILDQFPYNEIQDVFSLDSLESSHPISVKVDDPDQIRQIFDRISYGKGASIIRMMNHSLGEGTFRAGLKSYLTIHGYDNAFQDDLWEALTNQAHIDGSLPADLTVKKVMDTWTLQTGFPVVTVTRDYEHMSANLSQERFFRFTKKNDERIKDQPRWWIPVTYTTQDSPDFVNTLPSFWMNPEEDRPFVMKDLPSGNKWILLNTQETGYYRVNYDLENWKLINEQLQVQTGTNEIVIPPVTKSQLIDDALNLARADLLRYSSALDLCLTLEKDVEYLPWASAFRDLKHLDLMLANTSVYSKFKEVMLKVSRLLIDSVGWTTESSADNESAHIKSLKRVSALSWACRWGDENCISEAKTRYANWMKQYETGADRKLVKERNFSDEEISPDLRGVVYCTGIKYGSTVEWDFAWQRYLSSNVGTEREILLDSLGCTDNVVLLQKYIGGILNGDSGIRKQDGARVFSAVANNRLGNSLAFDFLRNNWDQLLKYYGVAFSRVSSMVLSVSAYMNTRSQLDQLKQFWKDQQGNLGTADRSFKQSIENVEANVWWMEMRFEEVKQWLQNH